jgi:hypothetical protein
MNTPNEIEFFYIFWMEENEEMVALCEIQLDKTC